MLSDCSNYGSANIYKREALWVVGNLLGGQSELICEIILHTKDLFQRILELSSQ